MVSDTRKNNVEGRHTGRGLAPVDERPAYCPQTPRYNGIDTVRPLKPSAIDKRGNAMTKMIKSCLCFCLLFVLVGVAFGWWLATHPDFRGDQSQRNHSSSAAESQTESAPPFVEELPLLTHHAESETIFAAEPLPEKRPADVEDTMADSTAVDLTTQRSPYRHFVRERRGELESQVDDLVNSLQETLQDKELVEIVLLRRIYTARTFLRETRDWLHRQHREHLLTDEQTRMLDELIRELNQLETESPTFLESKE